MTYRFVQLSDIHFGQEQDGSLPKHEDVRRQLIADAAELAKRRGAATMVLVVGDTAFSGKKHEYDRAGLWLDALTKAVGCPEKSVRLVPGNHDCDRDKVGALCRIVHDMIRSGSATSADSHLEKIARESDPNPLLEKMQAYHVFASGYKSEFLSAGAPYWINDLEFPEGVKLRLIGMNSVQVCDDKDGEGKMVLGVTQYVFPTAPHIIPVVLVHHPLHWFMDKAEAEPYLHNRAHVIMMGHEHISKISKVVTVTHERVDLSSGATNPNEVGPLYRHTYNWIELSLHETGGKYQLKIEVFARAWVPDLTRFDADRPRMNGADSVAFEVACPQLKPPVSIAPATGATAAAVGGGNMGWPATAPSPVQGGVTVQPIEDDVSQLRFLFWRHLDWRQRLTVLVEADVLPASAEKPISQNLERMAIEKARADGKLAAVWDAIMRRLPAERQQANPFDKP